jgi:putative hydrolase
MFAGPVPIPIPEGLKDPRKLMELLGSTSFAMQLGQASGTLAHEVFGSFDQGMVMTDNPAGALLPENMEKFATELELPLPEVMSFLALRESAHSRLYSAVPWLMPRVESLISKYARGISIDLDAVEEQLRDADEMNPEGIAGAVNMAKVGMKETDEQKEALHSLEILLALVEGWVDAVTWRAGTPFLPHIEQLREMMRRRRAAGGPAEQTFENLIGLKLRPRKLREAAALWERITTDEGAEGRDAHWSHPDRLPVLEDTSTLTTGSEHGAGNTAGDTQNGNAADSGNSTAGAETGSDTSRASEDAEETHADGMDESAARSQSSDSPSASSSSTGSSTDWDAELTKLLAQEAEKHQPEDGSAESADSADGEDSSDDGDDSEDSGDSGEKKPGDKDK